MPPSQSNLNSDRLVSNIPDQSEEAPLPAAFDKQTPIIDALSIRCNRHGVALCKCTRLQIIMLVIFTVVVRRHGELQEASEWMMPCG